MLFLIVLSVCLTSVKSLPCGVCECYTRTGYVACSESLAEDVEDTLDNEDFAWARLLDLRNIDGVIDMGFYSRRKFPGLTEIDLTGIFS